MLILVLSHHAQARHAAEQINQILLLNQAPQGVVFEISSSQGEYLDKAIPQLKIYADMLHQKFPQLAIAVVSHGKEMLALQVDRVQHKPLIHQKIKSLIANDKVKLHVCGTYAGWHELSREDFPDYIDVAPVAPVQIKNYQEVGYIKILLDDK